jgi:hypothetical protein
MSGGTLVAQAETQGALAHEQGEDSLLSPNCVEARQALILMHQRPMAWGDYQTCEGVQVVDIEDDPSVLDEEKAWLRNFREQVPSLLGPSEVLMFVTEYQGEEREVFVPHERLAAMAILAAHPGTLACGCGQSCGPRAAIVAPDQDGKMAVYCNPLCHAIQTSPESLAVNISIFGSRRRVVRTVDPTLPPQETSADPFAAMQALAARVNKECGGEWDDADRQKLHELYLEADGGLTLRSIAGFVGASKSTIGNWFKQFES